MVEKTVVRKEAPKVYIQPDWDECLSSFNEPFWLSIKRNDVTLEGSVKKCGDTEQLDISIPSQENAKDILAAKLCNKRKLQISCHGHNTIFKAPLTVFDQLHGGKPINCMAVTEELGASSSASDPKGHEILLWQLSNGEVRRKLEGHAFYVESIKFFPSNIVLLSASIDIRVWSCESGNCPRTMIGHHRPVSDLAIIEKGKNVLSVSDDGQAKLWSCARDVKSGKEVKNIAVGCGVTCVDVIDIENPELLHFVQRIDRSHCMEPSEEEIGTKNKLVALGCTDGTLRVFGLSSGKEYLKSKVEKTGPGSFSSVNCLNFLGDNSVVFGCDDGSIHCLKIFPSSAEAVDSETILESHAETLVPNPGSPILDIKVSEPGCFIYSTQDGRVTKMGLVSDDVTEEFTGVDCDPVYQICLNSSRLFSASRDGKVRVYERN